MPIFPPFPFYSPFLAAANKELVEVQTAINSALAAANWEIAETKRTLAEAGANAERRGVRVRAGCASPRFPAERNAAKKATLFSKGFS